jgi:hypothetical protein
MRRSIADSAEPSGQDADVSGSDLSDSAKTNASGINPDETGLFCVIVLRCNRLAFARAVEPKR